MASLHKDPRGKSSFWYCAYTKADGIRSFRSTKTSDKKQAWQICNAWSKASSLGAKLTPDKARQVIASGIADVLMASGQDLPSATIRDWCKRWLEFKEVENEPRTHERYKTSVDRFIKFLGSNADKDLTALRVDDVIRFRDDTAKRLSVTSTNMDLKVLRACLYAAVRQELLDKNVATKVSVLKQRGEHKRRPFTLEEVREILKVCDECGGEWRGLVLTGVYTGQRLGDVAHLTWSQVDLQKKEISFVTAKTGKRLRLSIAKPLLDYFLGRPSADKSVEYVFPVAAAAADKHTGTISTKFYDEILVPSGCVPARLPKNESSGQGRDGKRKQSELSFHSFRHTLTTWLKSAGASNALAQMIIGHDSEVVSRGYTHLSSQDSVESSSDSLIGTGCGKER